jgi:hypothetical protein
MGTSRTSRDVRLESANWAKADIDQVAVTNRDFIRWGGFPLVGLSDYSRSGNRLYGLPWRRTPYCSIVGMEHM